MQEAQVIGLKSKTSLDKNVRPNLKNKAKRTGCLTQVVECLSSKHKTLSSNPSTPKQKQMNKQNQEKKNQAMVCFKN
jgi:hypothetical protein